jgi:hypothetical protein
MISTVRSKKCTSRDAIPFGIVKLGTTTQTFWILFYRRKESSPLRVCFKASSESTEQDPAAKRV